MAPTRVLITGVTGYIGGTLLTHLLTTTNATIKSLNISILTRDDPRADTFRSDSCITHVYTIGDLDDSKRTSFAASQNDIVISCVLGYHASSAKAMIEGLAQRKAAKPDADVLFIQTSGTSDLADNLITKSYIETRTFSDADPEVDLFAYLKHREALSPYIQRSTTISVIETGLEMRVPAIVMMPPTIYGLGSGSFNHLTIQYPMQMRAAMKDGYASYIADGAGEMGCVHVEDLAALYELVLLDFVSGARKALTGERGIVFSASGGYIWREVAERIGAVGKELGILESAQARSCGLQEAADKWAGGDAGMTEVGLAGNSRTKADIAVKVLGWTPRRGRDDWEMNFREEFEEVLRTLGKGYRAYGSSK